MWGPVDIGLNGNGVPGLVRDDYSDGRQRKRENRRILGKGTNAEKGRIKDHEADPEIKEAWDIIADLRVEIPRSDNAHSPSRAPQAEESKEDYKIDELFKIGKKNKKKGTNRGKIALLVESVLTELKVAFKEDVELNKQEKPAITKLRNLSLLTDIIPRKHLQQEFLHSGVLDALKDWLEPLPDGSIPSIDVRAAVFKCLNDLTIDLEQSVHRDQMKRSGIGKAVMFYYKYDEETTANRKLAKELVEKWCRIIFKTSRGLEDMKKCEERRTYRRPPVKRARSNAEAAASRVDLPKLLQGPNSEPASSSQRASRPEAMPMDFVVRPQSKVDPEAVRARAKRMGQVQHRAKLSKKLEEMRAPKRK